MKRETINSAVNHVLHHIIIEVCDVTEMLLDFANIAANQNLVQHPAIALYLVQLLLIQNITLRLKN